MRVRRAITCGCAVLLTAGALAVHAGIVLFRLANPATVRARANLAPDGTLELEVVITDMPDWFVGAEDRAWALFSVQDDRGQWLQPAQDQSVVLRDMALWRSERGWLSHMEVRVLTHAAPDRRATAVTVRGERSWDRSRNRRPFQVTCQIER